MQPNPFQPPSAQSPVEERRRWRLKSGESALTFGTAIRWSCGAVLYPGVIYALDCPQGAYWVFGVWIGVVVGLRYFAGRVWAACTSAVLGVGFGARHGQRHPPAKPLGVTQAVEG